MNKSRERAPFPKWLLVLAVIVLIATFIIPHLNFTALTDWIRTIGYEPSTGITQLESKVKFTDEGQAIFRATHPSLEDNEAFNRDCSSHDHDVSILGCYAGGQIYIYNINSSDLDGVKESTAAHEMLHAAWDRLSTSEQQKLTPLLNQVYAEHHDELADDLKNYDQSEQLDELHSRIGTQIADLPSELESHYARYFQDQDDVVKFYDQYQAPFKQLRQQLDSLSAELESLKSEIDTRSESYSSRAEAFQREVTEFNACTTTPDCYTDAEFNTKQAELTTEQSALNTYYKQLSDLVDEYNQKVDEYNSNILRTQNLQNSINSNKTPATI